MNRVFREEKKYLIGMAEALQRSHLLGQVMREDPHNGVHGYRIRSLYFDTVYDEDYHEKLAGIETRRKIRLRCYDPAAGYAMLEMKQKQGASQLKRSLRVTREVAQRLITGDYAPLLQSGEAFAAECYALMQSRCYRPKAIVEYDRKAFIAKENKIRVTFDSRIVATESSFDLFDERLNMAPVLAPGAVVMEVKYNGFLLDYIRRMINTVDQSELSVSKYMLARQNGYDRSFLASRILFDQFNGSLIISGAFGLFRKDVVIAAGGYNVSTLGEDMELVVKLHEYCTVNRMDYCIRYATDAICWTQAPERLSDLKKQRRRWHLGLFQSMMKHRGILFNPQFGAVSFISYFYFLVYELLSPVIEIFGVATMVLAWFSGLINVRFMVLLFLIYVLFGVVLSLTAFFARMYTADLRVSFADMMKAVLLCFFEITCLRFVLTWVRATAFFGYRKSRLQWGSMKRKTINYN